MERGAWPLEHVVGRRMKSLRVTAGARQADVSIAARDHGLRWVRSTVAMLEAGARPLSAVELALIPLVLSSAFGHTVTMHDLLDDAAVQMTTKLSLQPQELRDLLAGSAVKTPPLQRAEQSAADPHEGQESDYDMATEAERRAAAKLGIATHMLQEVALSLWGYPLEVQRDRVLQESINESSDSVRGLMITSSSFRAKRGHVTRELLKELQDVVSAHPPPGADQK